LATQSQQNANRRGHPNKLKGVTWHKAMMRYMAQIRVNYRTIYLGYFDRAEDAHAAYVAAAQKYFGEFARNR
jgi:hypothetical protein